jgi:hypothetical protein
MTASSGSTFQIKEAGGLFTGRPLFRAGGVRDSCSRGNGPGGDQTGLNRSMRVGSAVPVRISSSHRFSPGLYIAAPFTEVSAFSLRHNLFHAVHYQRMLGSSKKGAR